METNNSNTTNSNDHIFRCADIILNDKNISEETIIVMFMTYKELLINEIEKNKKQ